MSDDTPHTQPLYNAIGKALDGESVDKDTKSAILSSAIEADKILAEQREILEKQSEMIDDLQSEIEEREAEMKKLQEWKHNEVQDDALLRKRVSKIEESLGATSKNVLGQSLSYIERKVLDNIAVIDIKFNYTEPRELSKSKQFGLDIWENWETISSTVKNGKSEVVDSSDVRKVLETVRNRDIDWKQVYRAMDAIEDLTDSAIVHKETNKQGHMLEWKVSEQKMILSKDELIEEYNNMAEDLE